MGNCHSSDVKGTGGTPGNSFNNKSNQPHIKNVQNSKFAPKSEQECEQLREKNENQRSDDQPSSLLVQSGDNSGVSSVNWSAEPSHAVDRRTPQSRENQQQQHSPHTCPRGIPEPFQNFMHGCGRLDPDSPEPLARHGTVCAQIRPCGTGRRPTLARPFVETDVPATHYLDLLLSHLLGIWHPHEN